MIAVYIFLAIIVGIWIFGSCPFTHDWYTACTCATYRLTGPLPGESETHNGLGVGGYRYERHCRCCGRYEYTKHGVWTEFTVPVE